MLISCQPLTCRSKFLRNSRFDPVIWCLCFQTLPGKFQLSEEKKVKSDKTSHEGQQVCKVLLIRHNKASSESLVLSCAFHVQSEKLWRQTKGQKGKVTPCWYHTHLNWTQLLVSVLTVLCVLHPALPRIASLDTKIRRVRRIPAFFRGTALRLMDVLRLYPKSLNSNLNLNWSHFE